MNTGFQIHAERAFVDGVFRPASAGDATGRAVRLSGDYLLLPELINAHDHLQFNSFPLLGPGAPYADMYEWARDIESRLDSPEIQAARRIPLEDRLRIGGLKNLLSGVTTVVHHDAWHACFEQRFPVRVLRNYTWSHSLGLDPRAAETFRGATPGRPWMIHAAEGTSERAAREIDQLDEMGLIAENTILVHALAASQRQLKNICDKSGSIVTCPVSNVFLYGRTLDFTALPDGVRLALGSDSAATSSAGILQDIGMVRAISGWPEERLWNMATRRPAEMFFLPPGRRDCVVLHEGEPVLVIIDGELQLASEEFRNLFSESPQRLRMRDRHYFLSGRIRIPWKSLAQAAEWTPYLAEFSI